MTGATLIEVLVTMVIVAIGLLGLAGLQVANTRNALDAYYRSQATFLAHDIIDRIRVNRASAADYAVAVGSKNAAGADAVAVADVAEWKYALDNETPPLPPANIGDPGVGHQGRPGLPDGEGSISINANTVTVIVEWDDRRPAAANSDHASCVSATRKACFVTQAGI
jgi:type IV pilus assembly protein PilV